MTGRESVVPATKWTMLCTSAFGVGVHTVTDGLVWFKGQSAAAWTAGNSHTKAGSSNVAKRFTVMEPLGEVCKSQE